MTEQGPSGRGSIPGDFFATPPRSTAAAPPPPLPRRRGVRRWIFRGVVVLVVVFVLLSVVAVGRRLVRRTEDRWDVETYREGLEEETIALYLLNGARERLGK